MVPPCGQIDASLWLGLRLIAGPPPRPFAVLAVAGPAALVPLQSLTSVIPSLLTSSGREVWTIDVR